MAIKLFLTELRPFKHSHFGFALKDIEFSHKFLMNRFETLSTFCGHNKDVHVQL